MTDTGRLEALFHKYFSRETSPDENEELMLLISDTENDEKLKALIDEYWQKDLPAYIQSPESADRIFHFIIGHKKDKAKRISIPPLLRYAAAAAIIIFLATGAYFTFFNKPGSETQDATALHQADIAPGGDKAILTLSNGQKIVLDSTGNGNIATQGNVTIIKLDGRLAYNTDGSSGEVLYNTITTPRTGQYQLILADGTKVWLDSESSLRFPVAFAENTRTVEMTGQGYFEVSRDLTKPFHVKVREMNVEVLGTHFNIMAYNNEPAIRTTLVEGGVKVSVIASTTKQSSSSVNRQLSTVLKPGQQAVLAAVNGNLSTANNVDIEQALAWKNGMFKLEGTSLQEIMRQVERWYDVEVVYETGLADASLSGVVSRKQYVSQLLNILQATKVADFRLEGKKTIITKTN